ncbi:MAG: TldD/PmbA family protein [Gammaproteobacteria bacterium]|jgi:TldD protein|nr:TldD/PmbA family protein [Gammaproteobacteria bacterium]MBT5202208.1 TldD/PmbA family protein [Gammaproteobacteria bacterium]MBT6246654.1 TldD/PmbA family protein [Gammaproteobacteria bacterium]
MLNPQSAQSVIDHGISLGADFAELFVEQSQSNTVSTLSNQVQSVESGIDFGIGIRLVYGSKVLYGYTNKPEADELKRIMSELAAKDLRVPGISSTNFDFRKVEDLHSAQRTLSIDSEVESKVAFLMAADAAARAAGNMISQTRGSCRQKEQNIELFNSEGLHTTDTRQYIRTGLTSIASDGSEQATGSWSDGGLLGWELQDDISAEKTGSEASRQALVNLSARACPSGRMPVIIGNGFGGVIFHEACGHLLETTSVAKKASVFHDQMGQMIANPCVNAVDDGLLLKQWGSINIDDEGLDTQRTQLIKDGQLTSFLVDRIGAQQTGFSATGSGRRESYKFAPASRMRNTFIEPGDAELDDMIGSIDRGIYASHMGGGSVQPGTGEFNFAVTEGYYIENGKIQYPVKAATLISTGPAVLKEISMVGKDFSLACGMCGSVSGAVPTSVGQATLKVDDILVGGNA